MHNTNKAVRIDFANIVDSIGSIKSDIADLKRGEEDLLDTLKAAGPGAYDGRYHRATVSVSDRAVVNRNTFITELVKAGVDPEVIVAAEFAATTVSPATTVRVCARKA